ncbi:MAG: DUF5717 family protein [Bacteroides sp.]
MKDTINRLARGEFMHEIPVVDIAKDNLEQSVPVGSIQERELKIAGSHDYVKGLVYSDNSRVVPERDSFFGVETIMHYTVNTKGLEAGEVLDGHFNIVSNAGEISIPYCFKVVNVTIESSIGPIHNLFHFANLAQVAPDEACRVFLRKDFEDVFLKNDMSLCSTYRSLLPGTDTAASVEEFLIAVKKKQPVTLKLVDENGQECEEQSVKYEQLLQDYHDTLIIHKSTWGYVKLPIVCDADFIELEHDCITSDDFAGNRFELGYIIKKDRLHAGRNYARIRVGSGSFAVTREIEIKVGGNEEKKGRSASHDISLRTRIEITKLYINFRTHRINVKEWAEASTKILERAIAELPDEALYKIMQAQIYCIEERDDEAGFLLNLVKDDVMQDTSSILYCYFLYVNSLYRRDEEYTQEVRAILKKKQDYGNGTWELLWMLFYLDSDYDKNQSIKLARIKEMFHAGCHSPIMYLEACVIINSQPVFLRIFDEFERQVINFGCKYGIITEKTARHICEIGQNEKSVSKTYLRILMILYDKYKSDDILTVLCEHLIRNQMRGPAYFNIYETCILRGLRITRLYEFYMDSVDASYDKLLPKMVLMYFSYNNHLNASQKAFLYANIIKNLPKKDPVRLTYAPQMEQFAIEQLRLGQISNNLVTIYKDIWNDALVNESTALAVARLLFAYKLVCFDDNVKNVIVLHKELNREVVVPVIDNTACISIYTEGCSIAFEYPDGTRKHDSVHYELERLMDMPESVSRVYGLLPDDIFLEIYYYEQNRKYHKSSVDALGLREKLINSKEITPACAMEIQESLVDYYHDKYTGDDFKNKLALLEDRELSEKQAASLIETCVSNAVYEQAYDMALAYGIRKVSVKRLYKLCRHMLEFDLETGNTFLTQMCYHVFKGKKYDAQMLEYLQQTFNGTTEQMLELWDSCRGFETESYELEERIVAQMIFTHNNSERLAAVFACYYEQGARERVVEAYLEYMAHEYFILGKSTDEKIFRILESRIEYEDDVTDLCKLALLFYYSGIEKMDEGQVQRARNLLGYFCGKDMMFAFFQNFADKLPLPYKVVDKTIVEYRTNPDNKVTIHYVMGDGKSEDYISEVLPDTFMGIFTKAFTLFYGDTIQYYITENANGKEIVSDSMSITCDRINMSSTRGRYEYINDMLASRDSHDMVALNKLMHEYCVEDYVTKQLFSIK